MTLWGGMEMYAPGIEDYKRREKIPEDERCENCDGLGSVRFRHSGCFGNSDPRGSKDWHSCWACDGTGRKPEDEE
jgi:hypothetical protein